MIIVRKLEPCEMQIITKLYRYNDAEAAINENCRMVTSGTADIFCIFDGENPFGELRVKYRSDNELYTSAGKRVYLYAFRINKEYRGRGYGKLLIGSVIDELEKRGYSEFTIGVSNDNARAKHIYRDLGFTEPISVVTEEYRGDKYSYTLYLKS